MIRFQLACDQGHEFEAWFGSNADFDAQAERGLVSCPHCGSTSVGKALMAPAVKRTDRMMPAKPEQPTAPMAMGPGPLPPEAIKAVHAMVRQIRATAEHVGPDFAKEARDIHDGLKPERPIIGEATSDEVRALFEDEIPVMPLPPLPEDRN